MNTVSQRENMYDSGNMESSCYPPTDAGFTPYPSRGAPTNLARTIQQQQLLQQNLPQAQLTAAHESILSQLYTVSSANPVYAPSLPTPYPLFVDVHTGAPMRLTDMAGHRPTQHQQQQPQVQRQEETDAMPEQFRYTAPQRARTEMDSPAMHSLSASANSWQPFVTVGATAPRRMQSGSFNMTPYAAASNSQASSPMMHQHHQMQPVQQPPMQHGEGCPCPYCVRPVEIAKPKAPEAEPATPVQPMRQPEPATVAKQAQPAAEATTPSRPTKRSFAEKDDEDNVTPVRRSLPKQQVAASHSTGKHHHANTGSMYQFELRGFWRTTHAVGPVPYEEGQAVIFEGDRGVDLAFVRACTRITSPPPTARHQKHPPPSVLREASPQDVVEYENLRPLELEALEEAQRLVAMHGLTVDMSLVNAVYQFDRQKLTLYYQTKELRVDFRKLLNELFTKFRCRIWMEREEELNRA